MFPDAMDLAAGYLLRGQKNKKHAKAGF